MAVIDIGSNSVRQVIYEGLSRAPSVLFNEKILCGLGKEVARSGRMDDAAVVRAQDAVKRFVALGKQVDVQNTHVLATAAARDAENGDAFVENIENIVGKPVTVLTGEMEAEYAALGIRAGFHKPEGIAGDLGGGSLELIGVNASQGAGISLPLGGLKLREASNADIPTASRIVKQALKNAKIDWPKGERNFYAVGGTWRSLARLHMVKSKYSISVIHHYAVERDELLRFCKKVAKNDPNKIKGIEEISKSRRGLIPYGAVVMAEILTRFKPDQVIMSGTGLREGYLYSQLSGREKRRDCLLEAARELSILRARSPEHCEELTHWTSQAFETLGIEETEDEKRYRIASCYLADIAWRAQSDYRAEQSLGIISNAGFGGIDHRGRAYLGLANYHRHRGLGSKVMAPANTVLATPRFVQRARYLAAIFRLLYLFSASISGVLPKLRLEARGEGFVLLVPESLSDLIGERPLYALGQLSRELETEIELEVG